MRPLAKSFADVTQDVGHLEGEPELDRVFAAGRISVTENLDADEADGAGDAVTIHAQIRECLVAEMVRSISTPCNDLLQHLRVIAYLLIKPRTRRRATVLWLGPGGPPASSVSCRALLFRGALGGVRDIVDQTAKGVEDRDVAPALLPNETKASARFD